MEIKTVNGFKHQNNSQTKNEGGFCANRESDNMLTMINTRYNLVNDVL